MANYCDYNVIVKGRKNACYAFMGSMPATEEIMTFGKSGTDDNYTLKFSGSCKGDVDACCDF